MTTRTDLRRTLTWVHTIVLWLALRTLEHQIRMVFPNMPQGLGRRRIMMKRTHIFSLMRLHQGRRLSRRSMQILKRNMLMKWGCKLRVMVIMLVLHSRPPLSFRRCPDLLCQSYRLVLQCLRQLLPHLLHLQLHQQSPHLQLSGCICRGTSLHSIYTHQSCNS